jgi:hypothetical protein
MTPEDFMDETKRGNTFDDEITVEGSVDFSTLGDGEVQKIKSLPSQLHVNGYLRLTYTKIITLPSRLHVDSFLSINHTAICRFTDDLIVGQCIIVDRDFLINYPRRELPLLVNKQIKVESENNVEENVIRYISANHIIEQLLCEDEE